MARINIKRMSHETVAKILIKRHGCYGAERVADNRENQAASAYANSFYAMVHHVIRRRCRRH